MDVPDAVWYPPGGATGSPGALAARIDLPSLCARETFLYTVLIAALIGIAAGVTWTLLGLWKTWAMGIIVGTLVFVAVFALISRIFKRKIEPVFMQAQKQIQAGKSTLALKTLEDLLPMSRWQVLLKGQIYAQMGSLCYSSGDEAKALEYLAKSTRRLADSQLILAVLHYRRGDFDAAKRVLDTAIGYNKKQILLYNVYAYLLLKQGQRSEAIDQLMRGLKLEKDNESTKDNLLRLQNGKKMNMKRFGMSWYALQLEKPPASLGQAQASRRGFRQPKRRRR